MVRITGFQSKVFRHVQGWSDHSFSIRLGTTSVNSCMPCFASFAKRTQLHTVS